MAVTVWADASKIFSPVVGRVTVDVVKIQGQRFIVPSIGCLANGTTVVLLS